MITVAPQERRLLGLQPLAQGQEFEASVFIPLAGYEDTLRQGIEHGLGIHNQTAIDLGRSAFRIFRINDVSLHLAPL